MNSLTLLPMLVVITQAQVTELSELAYNAKLAVAFNGQASVTMPDGTECDLVTSTHAIEIEWATKPYEAIGQALHYAEQTDLKPGIIVLVKDPNKEFKQLIRLAVLCGKHNIKLWAYDTRK